MQAPAAPAPVLAEPALETVEQDEGEEEEDEEPQDDPDDEGDEDPQAPDPFVSPIRPALETLEPETLAQARAAALQAALGGEHKLYFSDPAGPGSLAEALNHLLQDGRVTVVFREIDGEEAHLLYRPKHDEAL